MPAPVRFRPVNAEAAKRVDFAASEFAHGADDGGDIAFRAFLRRKLRLKESVGPELLDTEGDAPQLKMELVRVDLLDAYRLLTEATRLARHGGLMRSLPMVIEAFDLIGGEVPFPTLYDDFFEAMREDFEFHMREAALEVGQGLIREGDAASAEEALRRAFNAMPGDEEITELLCTALQMQGKRAEAGRVRLRAEEMEE